MQQKANWTSFSLSPRMQEVHTVKSLTANKNLFQHEIQSKGKTGNCANCWWWCRVSFSALESLGRSCSRQSPGSGRWNYLCTKKLTCSGLLLRWSTLANCLIISCRCTVLSIRMHVSTVTNPQLAAMTARKNVFEHVWPRRTSRINCRSSFTKRNWSDCQTKQYLCRFLSFWFLACDTGKLRFAFLTLVHSWTEFPTQHQCPNKRYLMLSVVNPTTQVRCTILQETFVRHFFCHPHYALSGHRIYFPQKREMQSLGRRKADWHVLHS